MEIVPKRRLSENLNSKLECFIGVISVLVIFFQ